MNKLFFHFLAFFLFDFVEGGSLVYFLSTWIVSL